MEKQAVKEIALACGFKLEPQPNGTMDLKPRVYEFADQLLSRVRHGQEMMNMCKGALLSDALYLIHIGGRDSNDMEIAQALDILRSVRNELVSPPQPHTDTEQVGRMVQRDLPMDMPPVHDPVNHPSHYTSHPSGVEAIEITRHMGFNLGNAMKYLWRNGLKDGQPAVQDLEKAVWYIQDEIKRLKQSL